MNDLKQSEGFSSVKLKKVIKILKDTKSPSFTWQTVITAMESPVINNKEVADKIRRYLHFSKLLLLSNEVVLLTLSMLIKCLVHTFEIQNFIILLAKTLI